MKKHWWKESVIYQIYPRSFKDSNGDGIGDIPGIISKLDYLKELGIDVVWLSPVYKSPNDDNGYDISDYQNIMDDFGTMKDWELLLKEMHDRGLKLIMDLVVNHSSDEHHWFMESKRSKDNPYRDYYIWRPGKDGKEPNNWKSTFSGSAWQYDENTEEYYLHIFSKKQPDLNWENPKLRQEVYDMMRFWLDKGIDGFRMDVINFISKVDGLPDAPNPEGKKYVSGSRYFMNGPRIHDYLQEMHREALADYDVMTVGEMPGVNVEQAKLYTDESRNEVNMVFQFEHVDLDSGPGGKWDLKPLQLTDLKKNFTKWQMGLEDIGWNSLYLNNHDQPRMVSRFGNDKQYRVESAKMLATFLHMLKGTPYVYQGEEIGMTNVRFDSIDDYKDIETLNMYDEKVNQQGEDPAKVMESIYVKGRDNARTPFQWDDSEHGGFTTGTPWIQVNPNYPQINARQAVADENSIYHYYRKLIQLRKEQQIIVHGRYDILLPEDENIYVYTRTLSSQKLLVILNFTGEEQSFTLPADLQDKKSDVLVSNYEPAPEYVSSIPLRPYEAIVYLLEL
ncbi:MULTISPECIES: alpha-glucosidase [unclassified Mesobacillus]|uniref:glycoside hydrolase family 13 protein n=1 Tax=unclassified Mesobacillus TaxID=2675270 RepID=UPI00203D1C4D|nr:MULTISPECIES: alpha-glucosidase [unclassified Mesobacillus]MCM3121731.1 alpha-glucosidase [Mesobacillus sp. MER 33]MCM3231695.1 alpha-glucosidase [Mesobacillus sp. MER 48]